jgi:hypothetical protein
VLWKMHCGRLATLHYSGSIASSSRVLRFAQVTYTVLVGPSTKDRSASVCNLAAPFLMTERANFSTALPRAHAQACLLRRIVREAGSVPSHGAGFNFTVDVRLAGFCLCTKDNHEILIASVEKLECLY